MKTKWALIELTGEGGQSLLIAGNKKEVRGRFKDEKKRKQKGNTPSRALLLMKLWKQWPKKSKAMEKAA